MKAKPGASVADHEWEIKQRLESPAGVPLTHYVCREPGCECQAIVKVGQQVPRDDVLLQGCPFSPPEDEEFVEGGRPEGFTGSGR